jgi:hypothetical protein
VPARSDLSKRLALGAWALAATLLAAACAAGNDSETPLLCQPGDNIFCRCPNGDPSTKTCNVDGFGFGECACEDRPSSGPGGEDPWGEGGDGWGGYGEGGDPDPSGGAGGEGGSGIGGQAEGGSGEGGAGEGGSGEGGGPLGNKALFASCNASSECQSGMCKDRYCTKACNVVSDCPWPQSECVELAPQNAYCMPTCNTASDCTLFGAPPSKCGYTQAVDNWDVTVCRDWGSAHLLMPAGTDCLPFDHDQCNLGYSGMQNVCTEQGICAKGCYLNGDCPQGKTCSGQGSLGNCI